MLGAIRRAPIFSGWFGAAGETIQLRLDLADTNQLRLKFASERRDLFSDERDGLRGVFTGRSGGSGRSCRAGLAGFARFPRLTHLAALTSVRWRGALRLRHRGVKHS